MGAWGDSAGCVARACIPFLGIRLGVRTLPSHLCRPARRPQPPQHHPDPDPSTRPPPAPQGGDLYTALRHHADTMRWERLGRKVALDIALGLNYLHAHVSGVRV